MIKLQFDDGSYVTIPSISVKETDEIKMVDRRGKEFTVSWGSVIAQTNGKAIELLRAKRS